MAGGAPPPPRRRVLRCQEGRWEPTLRELAKILNASVERWPECG